MTELIDIVRGQIARVLSIDKTDSATRSIAMSDAYYGLLVAFRTWVFTFAVGGYAHSCL